MFLKYTSTFREEIKRRERDGVLAVFVICIFCDEAVRRERGGGGRGGGRGQRKTESQRFEVNMAK